MRIDSSFINRGQGLRLALAATAIAAALACTPGAAGAQEGAVTVRNPAKPGETLLGRVDRELVVQLESQPGTGYVWDLANSAPGLAFLGSDTVPLPGNVPGRGAVQSFRFMPAVAGEFRLDFVLERPWEDDPIDRQTVRIRVSE